MADVDVDHSIGELKQIKGFSAFCILNSDGIVIKYDNMTYPEALHYSYQVSRLTAKSSQYMKEMFAVGENEVNYTIIKKLSNHFFIFNLLG
jgi:hypothetical protein